MESCDNTLLELLKKKEKKYTIIFYIATTVLIAGIILMGIAYPLFLVDKGIIYTLGTIAFALLNIVMFFVVQKIYVKKMKPIIFTRTETKEFWVQNFFKLLQNKDITDKYLKDLERPLSEHISHHFNDITRIRAKDKRLVLVDSTFEVIVIPKICPLWELQKSFSGFLFSNLTYEFSISYPPEYKEKYDECELEAVCNNLTKEILNKIIEDNKLPK